MISRKGVIEICDEVNKSIIGEIHVGNFGVYEQLSPGNSVPIEYRVGDKGNIFNFDCLDFEKLKTIILEFITEFETKNVKIKVEA